MVVHSLIFDEASRRDAAVSSLDKSLAEVGAAPHCVDLHWQCSVYRGNCRSLATQGTFLERTSTFAGAEGMEELKRQNGIIEQTIESLLDRDHIGTAGNQEALKQTTVGINSLLQITQNSVTANPAWLKETALLAMRSKVVTGLIRNPKIKPTNELQKKYIEFDRHARNCTGQQISLYTFTDSGGGGFETPNGEKVITFLDQSRDTLFEKLEKIEADTSDQAKIQQLCNDIRTVAGIAVEATKAQYAQSKTSGEINTSPSTLVHADTESGLHYKYQRNDKVNQ